MPQYIQKEKEKKEIGILKFIGMNGTNLFKLFSFFLTWVPLIATYVTCISLLAGKGIFVPKHPIRVRNNDPMSGNNGELQELEELPLHWAEADKIMMVFTSAKTITINK